MHSHHLGHLYETGGISTDEFLAQLAQADPTQTLTTDLVKSIWISIFIGMPHERFGVLLSLRQRYSVFLLSNINALHLDWITDYLANTHQVHDFEARYFDGVYYSHLIRLRKPDADIYTYMLADAELKPEETVFFDDLPENIAAAQQAGITGYWHDPQRMIEEHLQAVGLI
jgi:glucose-1-phosphatase